MEAVWPLDRSGYIIIGRYHSWWGWADMRQYDRFLSSFVTSMLLDPCSHLSYILVTSGWTFELSEFVFYSRNLTFRLSPRLLTYVICAFKSVELKFYILLYYHLFCSVLDLLHFGIKTSISCSFLFPLYILENLCPFILTCLISMMYFNKVQIGPRFLHSTIGLNVKLGQCGIVRRVVSYQEGNG